MANKWFIPIILILLAIGLSTYFRMMPSSLPITDQWAEGTVNNYYGNQILATINQQYPNLPQDQKDKLIQAELDKIPQEQKDEAIRQVSEQYKSAFKDEKGDTYLLEIDPYMWWHYARNFINFGMTGDRLVNGTTWDSLRGGRFGNDEGWRFHAWLLSVQYKILNKFTGMSLMRSIFLFPAIFMGLSVILAFFISRKLSGNIGGFFTAALVAINADLLSRTVAGFSDTDTYNILCPFLILFFICFALETDKPIKKCIFAFLAGLSVFIYNLAWGGWWHAFNIFLAGLGFYFLYILFFDKAEDKKNKLKWLAINSFIFFSSASFLIWITGRNALRFIEGPLWAITMKNVGKSTIWPNVLTTVAEFNVSGWDYLLKSMGGIIIVIFAILGLIYLWKKNKFIFFISILWALASSLAFTKGVRFAILMVPFFAIACGAGIQWTSTFLIGFFSKHMNSGKVVAHIITYLLIFLLLISPLSSANKIAKNEIPLFNDAWYESLQKIKNDEKEGIITSWWDYGHWFYTIAERHVTFDGGDQNTRIHWAGKILLTNNETESLYLLKMLNCGQNRAYEEFKKLYGDEYLGITKLYEVLDKKRQPTAEEQWIYDDYIDCKDIYPQYMIASTDMIGKSGVWAHFGSWDFDRAKLWQDVISGKPVEVDEDTKYEILNTPGDQWIAPWPSYGGKVNCNYDNSTMICENGMIIYANLTVNTPRIRYIVYGQNGTIEKNENNPEGDLSIIISPAKGVWFSSNPLADSMFTRMFFFDGAGLKNYKQLSYIRGITGEEIYVYKVDLKV